MRRDLASIVAMASMLVVSQVIALALAPVFLSLNFQAFPDATNPVNPLIYIVLILAFTGVILLLVRYRKRNLTKYVYPEWYLVDTVGIAIAAGVTAVLGISFAIFPTFLLLIGLAVYDAWAVYRSKHMVTLADEMTSQKLPILLVVPKKASYSYLEQKSLKEQIAKGEEREAMFMGLGDIIIPGVLVVSASIFLRPEFGYPAIATIGLPAYLFVALGTMVGAIAGFTILMRFVMKGNPQAGLPLLNGGAAAGYLLSFGIAFGGFRTFGLV